MKLTIRLLCLPFWPKRVLGITKVTVWDFMRSKYPNLDEKQFYDKLMTLQLGQHPDMIYSAHEVQLECETKFNEVMRKFGCNFKMITNINKAKDDIEWADLVVAIGGNGTFLLASQLIEKNTTAVIGINPKCMIGKNIFSMEHCSEVEKVFQKLHKGKYNLLMRKRIRTIMSGEGTHSPLHHLDEKKRSVDATKEKDSNKNLEYV